MPRAHPVNRDVHDYQEKPGPLATDVQPHNSPMSPPEERVPETRRRRRQRLRKHQSRKQVSSLPLLRRTSTKCQCRLAKQRLARRLRPALWAHIHRRSGTWEPSCGRCHRRSRAVVTLRAYATMSHQTPCSNRPHRQYKPLRTATRTPVYTRRKSLVMERPFYRPRQVCTVAVVYASFTSGLLQRTPVRPTLPCKPRPPKANQRSRGPQRTDQHCSHSLRAI